MRDLYLLNHPIKLLLRLLALSLMLASCADPGPSDEELFKQVSLKKRPKEAAQAPVQTAAPPVVPETPKAPLQAEVKPAPPVATTAVEPITAATATTDIVPPVETPPLSLTSSPDATPAPVQPVQPIEVSLQPQAEISPELAKAVDEQLKLQEQKNESPERNTAADTTQPVALTQQIDLTNALMINEVGTGSGVNFSGARALIDEQAIAGNPLEQAGSSSFQTQWSEAARLQEGLAHQRAQLHGLLDLGQFYELEHLYIYGGNNTISISTGGPVARWVKVAQTKLKSGQWNKIDLLAKASSSHYLVTRYLRISVDELDEKPDPQGKASSGKELVAYGKVKKLLPKELHAVVADHQFVNRSWDQLMGVTVTPFDLFAGQRWHDSSTAVTKTKESFPFKSLRVRINLPWLESLKSTPEKPMLNLQAKKTEMGNLDLDYFLQQLKQFMQQQHGSDHHLTAQFYGTPRALLPALLLDQSKAMGATASFPWKLLPAKAKFQDKLSLNATDYTGEMNVMHDLLQRYFLPQTPTTPMKYDFVEPVPSNLVLSEGIFHALESHGPGELRAEQSYCPSCYVYTMPEFANYLSALYDGDEQTLARRGLKSKRPQAPLLANINLPASIDPIHYLSVWSSEQRRDGQLPFDQLIYEIKGRNQLAPEHWPSFEQLKNLSAQLRQYFPDKPLSIRAPALNHAELKASAGLSQEQTQAQWMLRALLLYATLPLEHIYLPHLSDCDGTTAPYLLQQQEQTAGLLSSRDQADRPKVWWHVYSRAFQVLNGWSFEQVLDPLEQLKGAKDVLSLLFKHPKYPEQKIAVLWTPTQLGVNHNYGGYPLSSLLEQTLKKKYRIKEVQHSRSFDPQSSTANDLMAKGRDLAQQAEMNLNALKLDEWPLFLLLEEEIQPKSN